MFRYCDFCQDPTSYFKVMEDKILCSECEDKGKEMRLMGSMKRDGKHWIIDIPEIELMTQANKLEEVADMTKDAVELLVEDDNLHIMVSAHKEMKVIRIYGFPADRMEEFILRRKKELGKE